MFTFCKYTKRRQTLYGHYLIKQRWSLKYVLAVFMGLYVKVAAKSCRSNALNKWSCSMWSSLSEEEFWQQTQRRAGQTSARSKCFCSSIWKSYEAISRHLKSVVQHRKIIHKLKTFKVFLLHFSLTQTLLEE